MLLKNSQLRYITGMANNIVAKKFSHIHWDNSISKYLPIEKFPKPVPHIVKNAIFSKVSPTPIEKPRLVAVSTSSLKLIGINLKENQITEEDLALVFSGNYVIPNSMTLAHCYCGHQFGLFSGQLGDGAAIQLGEIQTENNIKWTIQLKGSGPTPYSRAADGRKVLRSSIREFLCSENLAGLGIPTTRAGCVVTSDSRVVRDPFYSGVQLHERCTVVLRIARTFYRFGSFELFKEKDFITGQKGPSAESQELLTLFANYVIFTLFPHLVQDFNQDDYLPQWNDDTNILKFVTPLPKAVYREWFKEIVQRTAILVAEWQCVGWVHGVLNTDNMSIFGETIDYGPFGFMERYDPHYVPNLSDKMGRYSYEQQPSICRWNCFILADSLQALLKYENKSEVDSVFEKNFDSVFNESYLSKMRLKLNLDSNTALETSDLKLIKSLFQTMRETAADFTTTFLILHKASLNSQSLKIPNVLEELLNTLGNVDDLRHCIYAFSSSIPYEKMKSLVHDISGVSEDFLRVIGLSSSFLTAAQDILKFEEKIKLVLNGEKPKKSNDQVLWNEWLEQYAKRLSLKRSQEASQKNVNPYCILRNHLAEKVIYSAEEGDFQPLRSLLQNLLDPYTKPDSTNFDFKELKPGRKPVKNT